MRFVSHDFLKPSEPQKFKCFILSTLGLNWILFYWLSSGQEKPLPKASTESLDHYFVHSFCLQKADTLFTIYLWKSAACHCLGSICILRKFWSKPASTLVSLWHVFLLRRRVALVVQLPTCVQLFATPWMDCSMAGFPVPHHLQEFARVHVHWISDTIQPSHPLLPTSLSALHLSQHQGPI